MSIHAKFVTLIVVLLLAAGLSLLIYPVGSITINTVYSAIITPVDTVNEITLRDIRLPRTIVAILLGINLSLAGLILQALTRNLIASPGVLGISQSAGLFISLSVIIPSYFSLPMNVLGFIGGLLGGGLTLIIAGGLGKCIKPERMVLAGLAVGALTIALVRFAFTLDDDISKSILTWLIGSIKDVRWNHVENLFVWAVTGMITCYMLSNVFNILTIGSDTAKGLGLNVVRYGVILWGIATFLTAVSVANVGPILFLGLIIPHLTRIIFGHNHKITTLACPIIGSSLMLIADVISRYLYKGIETPIGSVIAFIGGIYFLFLIKKNDYYGK